jgi:hypothetical protein
VARNGNGQGVGTLAAKDEREPEPILHPQALTPAADTRVARPLRVLVPLIQDDLEHGREAAERAGMPYYLAAGEKLIEAKAQMKHGEFGPWVKRSLAVSDRQARTYMALAEEAARQNGSALPFSSLREFERETKPVPVIDTRTVNLKREELKRQEEREAEQHLAARVVDTGYRALAAKLHPDKGGTREEMARLNAVRAGLKHGSAVAIKTIPVNTGTSPNQVAAKLLESVQRAGWESGVVVGAEAALSALREHPEFKVLAEKVIVYVLGELFASKRREEIKADLRRYVQAGAIFSPTDAHPAPDPPKGPKPAKAETSVPHVVSGATQRTEDGPQHGDPLNSYGDRAPRARKSKSKSEAALAGANAMLAGIFSGPKATRRGHA